MKLKGSPRRAEKRSAFRRMWPYYMRRITAVGLIRPTSSCCLDLIGKVLPITLPGDKENPIGIKVVTSTAEACGR